MKRKVVNIDEKKCTGCGLCIPNCPEGALQIIDGKARLVSDLFCDGLGACIGHCPEDAITIEEREAEEYEERKVMENIVKQGKNVIKAHLEHLKEHNQEDYLNDAIKFLHEKGIENPLNKEPPRIMQRHGGMFVMHGGEPASGGCPGMKTLDLREQKEASGDESPTSAGPSQLRQWPIQLQLLNPNAPYFKNADLVVAADCVPFAFSNFHQEFLKDKILVIFCPKLDTTLDHYIEKLTAIFKNQDIKSISVVHMEVPCCFGTESIVKAALENSGKDIDVKEYTVSITGDIT